MEKKSSHLNQNHDLNHNQTSALFAAAQNGHTDCVELLLSSGSPADVSDENGFTPLHFAAAHGHSSCVEVLLTAGAAVDTVAVGGQTSLFLACEAGRLDCARVLLSAGADRSLTTVVSLGYDSTMNFFLLLRNRKTWFPVTCIDSHAHLS